MGAAKRQWKVTVLGSARKSELFRFSVFSFFLVAMEELDLDAVGFDLVVEGLTADA
jgi:hypothetical protein